MVRVAAIDLGASSGRIVIGYGTERGFSLREVHRFPHRPRPVGGVLRWDARALFGGICDGLRAAAADGPLDELPCPSAPALDLLAEAHVRAEVRLFES